MNVYSFESKIGLIFITVLDELNLGLVEEDEQQEITDRIYWENRGTKETVSIADSLLDMIHDFAPGFELKYNKFYIGLAKNGQPDNFVIFRAKKSSLRMELRLKSSNEIEEKLENSDLDLMDYDRRYGRYRIRLTKDDLSKYQEIIKNLLKDAFEASSG